MNIIFILTDLLVKALVFIRELMTSPNKDLFQQVELFLKDCYEVLEQP